MQVCVYKNLRNGLWSVCEATATGGRGKLIGHAEQIALSDARFIVRESRRQAVVAKKCREVHAWVIGTVCAMPRNKREIEVTYNPYRSPFFHYRQGGTNIFEASEVIFTDRCYVTGF